MKILKEILTLLFLSIPGIIIALPFLFIGYVVQVCKSAYRTGKDIYDKP
jgi:hypothetical protein